MRTLPTLFFALALSALVSSVSHAELRHLSSRLFEGGKNEYLPQFVYTDNSAPRLLVADAAGNLFLVAECDSFVSFGNGPVGPGLVVAKLDPSGVGIWSRVLVVPEYQGIPIAAIAAADDGGLVLTGTFFHPIDFGGGPLTPATQSGDVFVVKLDGTGAVAWQHQYGDRNEQYGYGVAVAEDGSVIITGSNRSNIDLGGGNIRTRGAFDVFVAKFDRNGAHVWSRGFGQVGNQEGVEVVAGRDGRIALACRMDSGGVDFGGGLILSVGLDDIVMAELDAGGAYLWSRLAASQLGEDVYDLGLDSSENLFVCGVFTRRLDLGGDALIARPSARSTGFVASIDPGGAHRWSYALTDSLSSAVRALDVDSSGNCFVVATKRTLVDAQFLLITLDSGGQTLFTNPFGNPTTPYHNVNLRAAQGSIFLAGDTGADVDFGGGVLHPQSGSDIYLARLAIRRAPLVSITAFEARGTGPDVRITWRIASEEALGNYVLTRRIDNSTAQFLESGPASAGDFSFVDRAVKPGHVHTYRLTVTTALGDEVSSAPASVTIAPAITMLAQNAPNPFNPVTTFRYSLATAASVSIAIYDLSGALIARLDQGMQPAGSHAAMWGGHNAEGSLVASGVYFYRLEGAGEVGARKMVLLK